MFQRNLNHLNNHLTIVLLALQKLKLLLSCTQTMHQSIDADMVARSFKKTGISNALDGTEDDALWTADSNSRVNDDAASVDNWDTDEQMCLADYTALFGNDDTSDESDFE